MPKAARKKRCAKAFGKTFYPIDSRECDNLAWYNPKWSPTRGQLPMVPEVPEVPEITIADQIVHHLRTHSELDRFEPDSDDEFQLTREQEILMDTQHFKDIGAADEDCDTKWDTPIHVLHEQGQLFASTDWLRDYSQRTLRSLEMRPLKFPIQITDPIRPLLAKTRVAKGKVGH